MHAGLKILSIGRVSSNLKNAAALGLLALAMGVSCLPRLTPGPQALLQDVSPTEAKALIDQHQGDPNFIIIDVRNPEEFATGHVENAVNICYLCPSFRDEIAGLDKSLTYLVYCGSAHRSPLACAIMQEEGFTTLYHMTGGLKVWKDENLPVVQ